MEHISSANCEALIACLAYAWLYAKLKSDFVVVLTFKCCCLSLRKHLGQQLINYNTSQNTREMKRHLKPVIGFIRHCNFGSELGTTLLLLLVFV